MNENGPRLIHAGCVDLEGFGVLITGKSGSGKSGLALRLLALGASLVADDQVKINEQNGNVQATCPEQIQGQIEARMVGILHAKTVESTRIGLVIDLDAAPEERIPASRKIDLCGIDVPLIAGRDVPNLEYAIMQLMRGRHLNGRD